MYGDIEELVLSGELFNPPSRSTSPVRSRSPSPAQTRWPNEDADYDYDSDAERRAAIEAHVNAEKQQQDSIGMGPGRTGVKGVIRDRAEAVSLERAKRAEKTHEINRMMEKASLGGKTWGEEEKERLAEAARLEGRTSTSKASRDGLFGHLREVGVRSYVQAVEEDRSVWVVMHIYDPSLDRCAVLDEALSRLARMYPTTKFLHARAGAIGFASSTSKPSLTRPSPFAVSRHPSQGIHVPGRQRYSDVDEGDEDEDDEDDEEDDQWEDDAVDTDVLPTLLVYRGGELVHSWVRVDWEAKEGIEDLLKRHDILSAPRQSGRGPADTGADSEDELYSDGSDLVFGNSDDEQ